MHPRACVSAISTFNLSLAEDLAFWERHGIDVTLDAQQIAYDANPGLNQTNASLKGNAWYDISHDLVALTNFQIAHLNDPVGSLTSPLGAV